MTKKLRLSSSTVKIIRYPLICLAMLLILLLSEDVSFHLIILACRASWNEAPRLPPRPRAAYSHDNPSEQERQPTNSEPTTRIRRIPHLPRHATDDLPVVAFEQLRRDKCTLDAGHEAFSVGRT